MWTLPCTAARAIQAALRRVRGLSCGPCAPFPRIGGRGRQVRHARPDTSPVSSSTPRGWPNDVRPAAASRPPPPPARALQSPRAAANARAVAPPPPRRAAPFLAALALRCRLAHDLLAGAVRSRDERRCALHRSILGAGSVRGVPSRPRGAEGGVRCRIHRRATVFTPRCPFAHGPVPWAVRRYRAPLCALFAAAQVRRQQAAVSPASFGARRRRGVRRPGGTPQPALGVWATCAGARPAWRSSWTSAVSTLR